MLDGLIDLSADIAGKMYRNRALFGALTLFVWILFADGEATKKVIFNSIECSLRGRVFSKIECQQSSRQALSIEVTIGEKPAGNIFGVCELTEDEAIEGSQAGYLSSEVELKDSILAGRLLRALSRAAVNLPARCPYKRANYTFKAEFYANNELGFEVKITGGFYIHGNDSTL